jgi:hypothetical protein
MGQNPVGEPAATAAWNYGTPRRRSKIDHDVVTLGDVSLRLGHRLVGRAPWSEAIAVLGERLIPPILENLQQGLLDQPVDDTRHADPRRPRQAYTRYLAEFEYRFNRRYNLAAMMPRLG